MLSVFISCWRKSLSLCMDIEQLPNFSSIIVNMTNDSAGTALTTCSYFWNVSRWASAMTQICDWHCETRQYDDLPYWNDRIVTASWGSDAGSLWLFPGLALLGAASMADFTSDLDLPSPPYLQQCSGKVASKSVRGPRTHVNRRGKVGTPSGHLCCDQCGATFASARGLKLHRDHRHFNKAPYTCEVCGRGFTMRGHYVGHMNMHNKIKTFTCLKCPKAFAHRSSLRYHLRNSDCGK